MYSISYSGLHISCEIDLPLSKSLSNRLLVVNYLQSGIVSNNLSSAADTVLMQYLLNTINKSKGSKTPVSIHTGNAGTVTRFLLPLLAISEGQWILTGDRRMLERPIEPLVSALQQLGADISYIEKENYLPLAIKGLNLKPENNVIFVQANISSQFVSGLMMIAPLIGGIKVNLIGEIVSKSYLLMTVALMKNAGAEVIFEKDCIEITAMPYKKTLKSFLLEADWSSAAFFYEIVALSENAEIIIKNLQADSVQGDVCLPDIFEKLGVKTEFFSNGIFLTKNNKVVENFEYDFTDCPDLVQAVAVTCAMLNINAVLKGVETLFYKETNRVEALTNELQKLGVVVKSDVHCMYISKNKKFTPFNNVVIKTYSDHRMAMAFAPLAVKNGKILMDDLNVVEKSFPHFWQELNKAHVVI